MRDVLDSIQMNQILASMDGGEENDKPIFYWGWYWRHIDFDADHVYLAASPAEPPEWWGMTAEYMLGQLYPGRQVGFCQNNKWGYEEFKVEGEQWDQLRTKLQTFLLNPTKENAAAVNDYMVEIAPGDEVEQEMEARDRNLRLES